MLSWLFTKIICWGVFKMAPSVLQKDVLLNPVKIPFICRCVPLLSNDFFLYRWGPTRAMASSFLRFLDHTQRRITVGRTPLDEWSARRRDLYLATHNNHNRQMSMPQVGFEPTIVVGEWPQTHALDRAATGTDFQWLGLKTVLKSD